MNLCYYNENDPKAAAWLRELMKLGEIPEGEVDERSIIEVSGGDLKGFVQCHFFAGIGGWAYALRLAGWPNGREVWTASCPCQPFSDAGKNAGLCDERHLWPAFRGIVEERGPAELFGEQVASKDGRNWLAGVRSDLEELGYGVGGADLCAAGVGAPHRRQRLFWMAVAAQRRCEDGSRDSGSAQAKRGGRTDSERCVSSRRLAFADGRDANERGEQRGGQHGLEPDNGGIGRRMDDTMRGRRGEGSCEIQTTGDTARGPSINGGMANVLGSGLERSDRGKVGNQLAAAQRGCKAGGMGDATSGGCGKLGDEAFARSSRHFIGASWSGFDLIPCRDGKARRIEPGSFPLAHGIPGRVGLLRGYGNAIVPQVAAEFIVACEEAKGLTKL